MTANPPTVELWGKSGNRAGLPGGEPYPLICHLLDTAGAARAICDLLIPGPMRDRLARAANGWEAWVDEVVFLAGAHDLGKATCRFQQQAPEDCPPPLSDVDATGETPDCPAGANRHAYASGLLLFDHMRPAARSPIPPEVRRSVQIVAGHHGVIPDFRWHKLRAWGGAAVLNDPSVAASTMTKTRRALLADLSAFSDIGPATGSMPLSAAAASHAVVVLADWIASASEFLAHQANSGLRPQPGEWAGRAGEWAERARILAVDRLEREKLGLRPPTPPAAKPKASDMIPTGAAPSSLQASLETSHPAAGAGITIITAPTGEGKTEAALLAASRYAAARGSAGWYFAMPTMGTADGLRSRLEKLLPVLVDGDPPPLHLLHSLRELRDSPKGWAAADPEARRWMASGRKAILAPCGVGTIDQALMGTLRVKHSPLRMFAVTAKTLIVDEAHTFDPYMRTLLCRLLEWLAARGTPVVLMSATLPKALADSFLSAYRKGANNSGSTPAEKPGTPSVNRAEVGYPGWVAWTPESGWAASGPCAPRRHWHLELAVHDTPASEITEQMARRAIEATRQGGCVMVVRETVRKAQDTYEAISAAAESAGGAACEVRLLHSRFRHVDRRAHTESLLASLGPPSGTPRPDRLVLIATQIVELSLDVDFDLVVTDPAPVAALLQRAGRCHRHERDARPVGLDSPKIEVFWPTAAGEASYNSHVYLRHDLRQARRLLNGGITVDVPDDVPRLVDDAHTNVADDDPDYWAWLAENDIQTGTARAMVVPSPERPAEKSLKSLTGTSDDDDITGTRLGAAAVQVLPVYPLSDGGLSAEGPDGPPLPEQPDRNAERRLYDQCVPVPLLGRNAAWPAALERHPHSRNHHGERTAWSSGPLARALLLHMSPDGIGHVETAERGTCLITVDARIGLRVQVDA